MPCRLSWGSSPCGEPSSRRASAALLIFSVRAWRTHQTAIMVFAVARQRHIRNTEIYCKAYSGHFNVLKRRVPRWPLPYV